MSEQQGRMKINVHVENYGAGGDGRHRAGIAIVELDGCVIAKLLTSESVEIDARITLDVSTKVRGQR